MKKNNQTVEDILAKLHIKSLNSMQEAAAVAIETQQHVMLLSNTGSGKTLAYLLPLLPRLRKASNGTIAMIIVPSRELALQIETVFKSMGTGLKSTCCYGGHLRETEENNLVEPPALLIGTPGRLADHIRRGNITVNTIDTLVLDEFDKSLELGFHEEMAFIIGSLKSIQQRILISATEGVDIPEFIELADPVRLNYLEEEKETLLELQTVQSDGKDKLDTLFRLICMIGNRSTIVFCNHRESVERTSNFLKEKDIVNVFYHGALEQQERDAALTKFRNGSVNVLVTTDLAARGLDIPGIRYIVHYHMPSSQEVFTHRNGRTARMDASGTAVLILSPEESVPPYITGEIKTIALPPTAVLPEKPGWTTFFIGAGKKDKVNKVDIVGFFSNRGQLKKEDIGLIDVKDFFSFVAIRKVKAGHVLNLVKDQKIKNKKVKIAIAK